MIDRQQFQMKQRTMPDHLANLQKLVPASLRGALFAILEITDVAQVDARREDRRGNTTYEPSIVLRFKEFPNRIMWLNKMGVNILADVFSEDETQWVGNQVPVVVKEGVKNPTKGGEQDMLWIAQADEWQTLFDEDEKARANAKAAAPVNDKAKAAREAVERRKAKAAEPSATSGT